MGDDAFAWHEIGTSLMWELKSEKEMTVVISLKQDSLFRYVKRNNSCHDFN